MKAAPARFSGTPGRRCPSPLATPGRFASALSPRSRETSRTSPSAAARRRRRTEHGVSASPATWRCTNRWWVPMPASKRLLISLHDVTPFHRDRIERAERLLTSLGITPVTYLLVPDFHGTAAAHASADFVDWCRRPRPFAVQWFLHGYFHRDSAAADRLAER